MCWACYTPLSGGATAAPHATASPHATAPASAAHGNNEATTKKAVPAWQIGAIGVVLLAAVGFSLFTMMGGPSTPEAPSAPTTPPNTYTGAGGGGAQPIETYNQKPGSAAGGGAAAPVVVAQPSRPGEMLFTVSLPPKDGVSWGTMAIVPSATAAAQNPASLAAAACQQAVSGGKWDGLYVYVFSDAASAQRFREYQRGRGGQPLGSRDYNALQNLWSQVPVRYEYSRGNEAIRYPSKNPGNWWSGNSSFRRAKI